MPVNVPTNIAIRDRVRADLVLPHPTDLAGEAGIEDLTEEQLGKLEKLRLFNTRFLASVRSKDPNAIAETRPPAGGQPIRGIGRLVTLVGDFDAVTGTSDLSFGPIGFPYIIRHIIVSAHNFGVAGSNGEVQLRLFVTGANLTGDTVTPAEPLIFPDFRGGTSTPTVLKVTGTSSAQTALPVSIPVLDTGRFLTAQAVMVPAADTRASLQIIIEEVGADVRVVSSQLPVGRVNLNPNTRPPAPRTTTPEVPRGAIVKVTQGGRILARRTIAWISLAPELKRLWFNQQVGAPPDPTIEWLR